MNYIIENKFYKIKINNNISIIIKEHLENISDSILLSVDDMVSNNIGFIVHNIMVNNIFIIKSRLKVTHSIKLNVLKALK